MNTKDINNVDINNVDLQKDDIELAKIELDKKRAELRGILSRANFRNMLRRKANIEGG